MIFSLAESYPLCDYFVGDSHMSFDDSTNQVSECLSTCSLGWETSKRPKRHKSSHALLLSVAFNLDKSVRGNVIIIVSMVFLEKAIRSWLNIWLKLQNMQSVENRMNGHSYLICMHRCLHTDLSLPLPNTTIHFPHSFSHTSLVIESKRVSILRTILLYNARSSKLDSHRKVLPHCCCRCLRSLLLLLLLLLYSSSASTVPQYFHKVPCFASCSYIKSSNVISFPNCTCTSNVSSTVVPPITAGSKLRSKLSRNFVLPVRSSWGNRRSMPRCANGMTLGVMGAWAISFPTPHFNFPLGEGGSDFCWSVALTICILASLLASLSPAWTLLLLLVVVAVVVLFPPPISEEDATTAPSGISFLPPSSSHCQTPPSGKT
mmetsp:Transcript_23842/g.49902  ORF Transcript_23842/g.49902 Transcript_23842/m.49902 type:complete len:375 (-) Transcript_23842:1106-2230(-)